MSIAASIGRTLNQTVTYWANASYDKFGDPSFAAPVQFAARFEAKTELFTGKDGQQSHSKAIVYMLTSVAVDGYLYLGTSAATNPETVSGADKILRIDGTPDLKAACTLYKAYL